jgi:pilus assembly protein Flp/PilA
MTIVSLNEHEGAPYGSAALGFRVALIHGRHISMALITSLLASFQKDEEGQGLAEYALILALIAIVAIVALIFLGNQVSQILSTVGKSI